MGGRKVNGLGLNIRKKVIDFFLFSWVFPSPKLNKSIHLFTSLFNKKGATGNPVTP
jgi:hypothetical protein